MPERRYDVFTASRIEGLTHKEIAERFSMTPRQVTTEIQRALEVFRSEFGDLLVVIVLLSGLK